MGTLGIARPYQGGAAPTGQGRQCYAPAASAQNTDRGGRGRGANSGLVHGDTKLFLIISGTLFSLIGLLLLSLGHALLVKALEIDLGQMQWRQRGAVDNICHRGPREAAEHDATVDRYQRNKLRIRVSCTIN